MQMKERLAHKSNYTAMNGRKIEYIVIHYTGNDGDTAAGNCNYFAEANRNASAHYFVDENEVWRSVEDKNKAWHCGGDVYYHNKCRNTNAIGIELCSRKKNGKYYFEDETIKNAVELTKSKMQEYGIPLENVVRHYDVTHKNCPAPFVKNLVAWENFKTMLGDDLGMIYKTYKDVPESFKPTIKKLIDKGALKGDANGNLNLPHEIIRLYVVHDRMGVYDK